MRAPDLYEQLILANQAQPHTHQEGVRLMNTLVTTPCLPRPRSWWLLGMRPPQHRWTDITTTLNTMTYLTLDRCFDCGLCVLKSGL